MSSPLVTKSANQTRVEPEQILNRIWIRFLPDQLDPAKPDPDPALVQKTWSWSVQALDPVPLCPEDTGA